MLITRRRLSVAAFVVMMTVAASFGFANGAQGTEAQTVQFMVPDIDGFPFTNPLKLYDKIMSDCNINLKVIPTPTDGWNDKFNVLVSSGDLPDVVFILNNQATVNEVGQKGVLLPISDNLAKLPSVTKVFEQYADDVKYLTAANGKVYVTPCVSIRGRFNNTGIILREDVLKKNGFDISSIKTTDDLYNAFLALLKANEGKPVLSDRRSQSGVPRRRCPVCSGSGASGSPAICSTTSKPSNTTTRFRPRRSRMPCSISPGCTRMGSSAPTS